MDYKKILEGVVDIINTSEKSDIGFANICSYIGENCPELKESDDEKIRKKLLDFCKNRAENFPNDPKYKNISAWIAWLEKQGEQKPYGKRKECVDCQFNYAGECRGSCAMKRGEQKLPIEKLSSEMKTVGESLGFTNLEEFNKYNQIITDLIMSDDDNCKQKPAELPKGEDYGAEKFIREHTKTCSNVIRGYQVIDNGVPQAIHKEWLTPDQARKAVEIAREEMIEWLRKNHKEYQYKAPYNYFDIEQCLEDLKQAMKDE